MKQYNIEDWYWEVGDQSPTTQVYSTSAQDYVAKTNRDYTAFISDGTQPTRINSEQELFDVLKEGYEEGLPDEQRIGGLRPRDIIMALNPQQYAAFITALGGTNTKAFAMFITARRANLRPGSPVRQALNAVNGVNINDIPRPRREIRWSNGD